MKQFKRFLSLLLVIAVLVSMVPIEVSAADSKNSEDVVISVENKTVLPGEEVSVDVFVQNNPGILGLTLEFEYDEGLTLTDAVAGEAFSYLTMTKPGKFVSPCRFTWDGQECSEEDVKDGTILTLTFKVADDMKEGGNLGVSVTVPNGDAYDNELNELAINTMAGNISVQDFMPGDLNGDKKVSISDIILLRRFIVDGYDISVNENAANVNGDDKVTSADVILLRRYLAGGYGVEPERPPVLQCSHEMDATAYKAPTCTEEGNIAYWYCSSCGKYFTDEKGNCEIGLENTVIPANGHTEVIDKAVEPTPSSPGLTEGSHCSVCGVIIVPQTEIKLTEYSISYDVTNGDAYLETLDIENDNPLTFTEKDSIKLTSLSVPGYRFLGWYDGAGDDAARITRIDEGTEENMELYAHWEKITYTVQFSSDLISVSEVEYTVDKGVILPNPALNNYIFAGWSDEEGNLYKRIPAGTIGNITLQANWTSERNKTYTKTKLDAPLIYEDDENNMILFTYEIGEIQNVPLYTIKDFGYISGEGITKTETTTYSATTSKTEMDAYAKAVSSATTQSSSWTLSEDWSDVTSLNESWYKENGYTEEEAQTVTKSDTDTWNISSGTSGSSSVTSLSSSQNDKRNDVKVGASKSQSASSTDTRAGSLNTSVGIGASATANIENTITVGGKVGVGGAEVSASDSLKTGLSTTVSANAAVEKNNSWSHTDENSSSSSGSVEVGGSTGTTVINSTSSTNTSSWNKSSSYGGSSTNSTSKTTSAAISELIGTTYGYGKSYTLGGSESNTQGLSSTDSTSDEYSSSVTYNTAVQESVTSTWTTQSTKPGYHRWVVAGTAHVFAVVGYDVATSSYFVYTYSVMDDETHEFEDYSYTTNSYNDNQNGVIPFEVPYEVVEYVTNHVAATDGLKVDSETGIITDYTGTDSAVIIPEYMNINNGDNTVDVIKITGISENAFRGNKNIKAVILSDFITEIPDNAFADCTSLIGIGGRSITKIGNSAFSGCESFAGGVISEGITEVGTNAFDGTAALYAYASNAGIVQNAITSDVETLVFYLYLLNDEDGNNSLSDSVIEIPDTVKFFALNGYGGKFNNTSIVSKAKETMINRAAFTGKGSVPLRISSEALTLNQVSVSSSGIAMILDSETTELGLQGTVTMHTDNINAVLSRNIKLYESNKDVVGKLSIDGKLIVCGSVDGQEHLNCSDIEYVDKETFEKLLHSYTLYFDANGGKCDTASIEVANSTAIGEMPEAFREGFSFDGWYLEDGTAVNENSVFSSGEDLTVYAHWSPNEFTASWENGTGYAIDVNRKSSPYGAAPTGALSSGDIVYYGDVLEVTYSALDGFTLESSGEEVLTVTGDITDKDIYVSAIPNSYSVSWATGTGYNITVKRISSPYKNAGTGMLASGDIVYYGDILSISYSADTGYTLGKTGNTSVTVAGDITSDSIYASASANSYTYNVVYKSSNGTDLGSTKVTYKYGTRNTISAPAKNGYNTPGAQIVAWDSTNAKTITFTYTPVGVSTSQQMASGNWYVWNGGSYGITYSAYAEYTNRTSNSVQIRVVWTNTMKKNSYYGYAQYFTANIGGISSGEKQIASSSTWNSYVSYDRTATADTGWITVSVSPTQTSVGISASYRDVNSQSGSWSRNISIPAY